MTVWDRYTKEQRNDYKSYLKMYSSLSAMFNQKSSETGAPYLDSKFQETIYARSFNSEDVDIGNTPHDIRSRLDNQNIGIGIKTWLSSKTSYQKVMQLKRYKDEINEHLNNVQDLAFTIANIKNQKLKMDYKRLGLTESNNIYHYVTRDRGTVSISETSYPLINVNNIETGSINQKSFTFSDGEKDYKYTFGDSQIWMRFGNDVRNTELLETLDIQIIENPFTFLHNAFEDYKNDQGIIVPKKKQSRDYLYLPLYSYKEHKVYENSGLNAWNGKPKSMGSTTVRPEGEAYIPIPREVWKKNPYWVDSNLNMYEYDKYKQEKGKSSYQVKLHMPDGKVFDAIFAQQNFKALQTDPQSILGKWILDALGIVNPKRTRYDCPSDNIVTMDLLEKVGYDSIKLWHGDESNPNDLWIDFAELGSFDRFMKDELQTGEEYE